MLVIILALSIIAITYNESFAEKNTFVDSIKFRDLPLVEATILIAAAFYVFANLLTDILSILFNPKLRKE